MALPPLSPKLGKQVTFRQITWKEMAIRAWGSEYRAPDHGVYEFSNGRRFDSTDMLTTGIYRQPPAGATTSGKTIDVWGPIDLGRIA